MKHNCFKRNPFHCFLYKCLEIHEYFFIVVIYILQTATHFFFFLNSFCSELYLGYFHPDFTHPGTFLNVILNKQAKSSSHCSHAINSSHCQLGHRKQTECLVWQETVQKWTFTDMIFLSKNRHDNLNRPIKEHLYSDTKINQPIGDNHNREKRITIYRLCIYLFKISLNLPNITVFFTWVHDIFSCPFDFLL